MKREICLATLCVVLLVILVIILSQKQDSYGNVTISAPKGFKQTDAFDRSYQNGECNFSVCQINLNDFEIYSSRENDDDYEWTFEQDGSITSQYWADNGNEVRVKAWVYGWRVYMCMFSSGKAVFMPEDERMCRQVFDGFQMCR